MIKVHVLLATWPWWIDSFIKSCDVLNTWTHVWKIENITISYNDDIKEKTFEELEEFAKKLCMKFEMEKDFSRWNAYKFYFFYPISIETDENIVKNNGKMKVYFNPKYQFREMVSQKWESFFLDNYFERLGIPFKIDDFRMITEAW